MDCPYTLELAGCRAAGCKLALGCLISLPGRGLAVIGHPIQPPANEGSMLRIAHAGCVIAYLRSLPPLQ
jgi:hypothetical protein